MNRKFKKIFLTLILIIVSCSSIVLAADDYGPVQYDATGAPYIVTNKGARVIEHPKKNMDKEVVETIFKSCI